MKSALVILLASTLAAICTVEASASKGAISSVFVDTFCAANISDAMKIVDMEADGQNHSASDYLAYLVSNNYAKLVSAGTYAQTLRFDDAGRGFGLVKPDPEADACWVPPFVLLLTMVDEKHKGKPLAKPHRCYQYWYCN